ncbi:MAG: Nif3-like dinuclear metal center hexameric protein, partial [Acidobacteriota bacterium]
MARVKDILAWLDAIAPFRYAASWDRCGLQAGEPGAEVNRVLVALDPSTRTVKEAADRGCQCLVTHHPLIFKPVAAVLTDRFPGLPLAMALRNGINLVAAHTNLDAAREGTNDRLAELLGLELTGPLETERAWEGEENYGGMGRIGAL